MHQNWISNIALVVYSDPATERWRLVNNGNVSCFTCACRHKSPFVWYVVLTVCVIEWGNWVCVEGMCVAKVVSVVIAL